MVASQDGARVGGAGTVNDLWRKDDDVARVREATDIVRLIGEHVALKAKGREYAGLCPFHDDHRPSMNVVPSKQIFHCFVCGAGGDVFTFVRKFHGMEFREALEHLAERAGITLSRGLRPASEPGEGVSRNDLVRANAQATDFFRVILRHPEHGLAAREVLSRRGISPEMVEAFGLGAAPDRWDGLLLTVQKLGAGLGAFVESGLLRRRESAEGVYDYFRNRLMFPIHDQIGRVIAFGARKIDEADEPKYLNSPETRLFQKSSTLYGLHRAARPIQTRQVAVITEGYTDTIACHQAGLTNVVATLGTALTRGHAAVLRRLCHTVVLLFDGDQAGQKAADRAVEVFFKEDLDVKIATLSSETDAKDPDELLKRPGGREVLDRAISGATDVLEYRYRRLGASLAGAGPSAVGRAIEEDLRRLDELGLSEIKPAKRHLVFKRLAEITGVNPEAVVASLPAGRASRRTDERGAGEPAPAERSAASIGRGVLTAWEHLLGCVLCDGALWGALDAAHRDLFGPAVYSSSLLSKVAQAVVGLAGSGRTPDLAAVLPELDELAAQEAAVALATRIETETEGKADRLREHWAGCLGRVDRDRPAGSSGASGVHEVLEMKRREHASLGADRRVLPRPR